MRKLRGRWADTLPGVCRRPGYMSRLRRLEIQESALCPLWWQEARHRRLFRLQWRQEGDM